jgi:hypothetical protein
MNDIDVWSQQPSHTLLHDAAAVTAARKQAALAANAEVPHQPLHPARISTQLAPLTLETYIQLHGALTRGSQTVQQALPGDASRLKTQELKQVRSSHRANDIPFVEVSQPSSNACMQLVNGRAS